jgi:hypothetical protein
MLFAQLPSFQGSCAAGASVTWTDGRGKRCAGRLKADAQESDDNVTVLQSRWDIVTATRSESEVQVCVEQLRIAVRRMLCNGRSQTLLRLQAPLLTMAMPL